MIDIAGSLRDILAGIGGGGVGGASTPLAYLSTVTATAPPNQFTDNALTGFGDHCFDDYEAYVLWDAGGLGAAPQGEQQAITNYVSATGVFTHNAYSVNLAVGDRLLLLHPRIAALLTLVTNIAALLTDVGDASTSALGSLYGILGNPAQNFNTMIGFQGATSLADKLTAARAALLDQITALRMAELDAGNLPADIAALNAQNVLILADTAAIIAALAGAIADAQIGLTTYGRRTAAPTNANGLTWVTLLDMTVLTNLEEIWSITLTIAGGWAGLCQMRIVEAVGNTKIFPAEDYWQQDTPGHFMSGIQASLPPPGVIVPIASGYKVQFRSSNGADGAGKTCALTELVVIARG